MLKIHQVFIKKFLFLFVGALFFILIISYLSIKSIIINNNKSHFQNSVHLLSIELSTVDNLEDYILQVNKNRDLNIAIINLNEKPAQEADFVNEVREFNYRGKEISIVFYMSLLKGMDEFNSLYLKLILLSFVLIVFAFYVANTLSKKVLYDIEQITNYLNEISEKNYKAVVIVENFYEFLQISVLLKNLVKKLHAKEKQKQKYIDKLRTLNKKRHKDKKKK